MTNSPATFQALMNSVYTDLIAKGEVAVYMDDILIYSPDLKEHCKVVHKVLKRLEHYDLYLKLEKFDFEKDSIEYLGMIISPGEVRMDPGKVSTVKAALMSQTMLPTSCCSQHMEPIFISLLPHIASIISHSRSLHSLSSSKSKCAHIPFHNYTLVQFSCFNGSSRFFKFFGFVSTPSFR